MGVVATISKISDPGRREAVISVFTDDLVSEHPEYSPLDHAKRDAMSLNLAGVPIILRDANGNRIDPWEK